MKTTWQTTWKVLKDYPRLEGDINADVVIVGGGITGITLAYLLAKKGVKPVVVEKGMLAESTTAYTTAFITYEVDTDLQDLRKIFGKDADLVWKSGKEAIDGIEKIIDEESIDCEFMRCPEYLFAGSEKEWEAIREEAELGKQAGFEIAVRKKDQKDSVEDGHGESMELPFPNHGYIIIKGQAKFHPLKYVDGLRQAAERHGAVFFENTEVTKIENVANSENNKDSVRAITSKGIITADWAVTATYSPFDQPKELFAKKGMYISYIIELSIALGTLPAGIYLDADNPYHYFRIDESKYADRMILGGEDHREEIPMNEEKNYAALLEYAKTILGDAKYDITTKWSGGVLETIDGLPYIGAYSKQYPNRLVATGFSGNGMTYSMIAGQVLRDHILKIPNEYAKIYDPKRRYSSTAFYIKFRDYAEELINGALKNIFRKAS